MADLHVYQSSDGQWIYFDGEIKHYFSTENEAITMSEKSDYIENVRITITTFADLAESIPNIRKIYDDRVYGSGGTAITDEDMPGNLTAANLSAGMTFFENLLKLIENDGTVTAGDYWASALNILRTDK
jgi:hypothetical protein